MARDPGSVWSPLKEAGSQGSYEKTQFIAHSTGDRASAAQIFKYFNGPTENESTFIVGWGPEDPTLQILDSTARADANVDSNRRGISVECVGTGDDPYNDWQLAEMVRLGIWSRLEHPGIAARICRSATDPGLGWHVMFGAPGPWTTAAGKVCPGKKRIKQLNEIVFPAIVAGTYLTVPEDDMSAKAEEQIQFLYDAVLKGGPSTPYGKSVLDLIKSLPADTAHQVWNGVFVNRPDGSGVLQRIPVIQELADVKTQEAATAGELAGALAALQAMQDGTSIDLAAVKQAAREGAEEALAGGVKVTVDVPGATAA